MLLGELLSEKLKEEWAGIMIMLGMRYGRGGFSLQYRYRGVGLYRNQLEGVENIGEEMNKGDRRRKQSKRDL